MFDLAALKLTVAAAAAVVLGLGYWHYTSIVDDLANARAEKAAVMQQLDAMTDIANRNADAAARADAARLAAVETLEFVQAGVEANTKTSRLAETELDTAPAADDGDVAPILEALRKSRFGGGK